MVIPGTYRPSQSTAREQGQCLVEEGLWGEEGFTRLYSLHAPQLFRYFWVHTRSRAQAEDLVSETFLDALRTLQAYRASRGPFSAWLFAIGRRALARHIKQSARVEEVDIRDIRAMLAESAGPGPEVRIDLWEAVTELSSSERELIALKFGSGLTHGEISEVMGLRVLHVGVVLYRALQKLRVRLSGEEKIDAQ